MRGVKTQFRRRELYTTLSEYTVLNSCNVERITASLVNTIHTSTQVKTQRLSVRVNHSRYRGVTFSTGLEPDSGR